MNILELTDEQLNNMSVEELTALHKQATDLESLWETNQMTKKILLNSLYGALGNKHFVLFNPEIGAAITGNGRYTNKTMAYSIDSFLKQKLPSKTPYLVYGDTDSCYLTLNPLVEAKLQKTPDMSFEDKINFCDNVCEKMIQPFVNETTNLIGKILNIHEAGPMAMDREIIADSTIFIAKKRYIARVLDTEGVRLKEPKKKVMGLELVRSSTPKFCRKYLKESIDILLDGGENELQDWVSDIKKKFYSAPIDEVSRVTGVNKVSFDLYTKDGKDSDGETRFISLSEKFNGLSPKEIGYRLLQYQLYLESTTESAAKFSPIPINTRAAIVHNLAVDVNNLQGDFNYINEKDKIKYVKLTTPNTIGNSDVFGYQNVNILDKLQLSKYIDKEDMWEKFFVQALDIMIGPLNWSHEKKVTIDEWF